MYILYCNCSIGVVQSSELRGKSFILLLLKQNNTIRYAGGKDSTVGLMVLSVTVFWLAWKSDDSLHLHLPGGTEIGRVC